MSRKPVSVLLFKHISGDTYRLEEAETDSIKTAKKVVTDMMRKESKGRITFFSKKWILVARKDVTWIDDSA